MAITFFQPILAIFGIKRGYYTDSDVFLADSVNFADSSDFRADSWTFFSRWRGNIENRIWAHRRARGAERRPERGAKRRTEAGAEPRGPGGVPRCDFQCCPVIAKKNVQLLSTEVRATQQNSRYSAKNNVAIRMIATFMPKLNEIFNSFFRHYAIISI